MLCVGVARFLQYVCFTVLLLTCMRVALFDSRCDCCVFEQVGSGTYDIIMQIVPLGVPGAMLIVFCVFLAVWIRMAFVYRQRIMQLRLGLYVVCGHVCVLAWSMAVASS